MVKINYINNFDLYLNKDCAPSKELLFNGSIINEFYIYGYVDNYHMTISRAMQEFFIKYKIPTAKFNFKKFYIMDYRQIQIGVIDYC